MDWWKGIGNEVLFPKELSIFEVVYECDRKSWNLWNKQLESRIPKETLFHEIYVPTTDSIRVGFISKTLLTHENAVILCGSTGTGKTQIVKKLLLYDLNTSKYLATLTAMSATTNCSQLQDLLESKLEK